MRTEKIYLMRSRVIKFLLTSAAILFADLLIVLINKNVMELKNKYNIHLITLVGMVVVLVLFYIVFININKISEKMVETFVQLGKIWMGRRIGLYFSLSVLFFFLYAGYYWAWFNRSLVKELLYYLKRLI